MMSTSTGLPKFLKRHAGQALPAMALLLAASSGSVLADDAKSPIVDGPKTIQLGNKLAVINMPKGFSFLPEKESKRVLESQGNITNGVLGIVFPTIDTTEKGKEAESKESKDDSFAVVCTYADCGYVNDDDANKINADELLKNIQEGTREQNEQRQQKSLPPFYAGNWAEKPRYDKGRHSVVWAIQVVDEDKPDAKPTDINYNTRILGREGVLSLNMITKPQALDLNKKRVSQLLSATDFMPGKTYADHKSGDKSAGFGLAGLILGGGAVAAAAKFGLFAGLWKWLLAGVLILKKFAIIAIAGIGALFSRLFGKKKAGASSEPPAPGGPSGTV